MINQTPTPITDVLTVAVPVSDQDQAVAFYVDALGFETRRDMSLPQFGRWIEVAPPGATVTIGLVPARAGAPSGVQTGIRLKTPDAAAIHRSLQARGAHVSELLTWPGVPAMFTVEDQDGNGLTIVEAA
jgi:lactoylglutathione lyase